MTKFKASLLTATFVAGFAATGAFAQVALPAPGPNDSDASLHGAGATSIQNVVVAEFNCIGADNKLGKSGVSGSSNGTFSTIAAGAFTQTKPSAASPDFTCTTNNAGGSGDIQNNFSSKYVATGSGFGRQMWREFQPDFAGTATNGSGGVSGVYNPFQTINGDAAWTHLQYAFSDTPISPSDLTAYNNGGKTTATGTFAGAAAAGAGAAIQFPKYVLPIAIAYNPVYGTNSGGTNMTFNVKAPAKINNVVAGGLKLPTALYCGIFNGTVTNFNDPQFKTANSNTSLQDTVNDTAARWASDGVPVRLVGRLDRSGSTDVFTRHLAAVCGSGNLYAQNAESLPYNSSSGTDLKNVREDTAYTASPTGNYPVAGTTNLVSNTYFNGSAIVQNNSTGPSAQPNGNQGSGLFLVADGGGKVRDAINFAPDYVLNNVKLNGKIGYISADFIKPAPGASLFAAQLPVNGGTTYAMPSAANALLAIGTILPPQSNSSGAFTTGDTRTVRDAGGNSVAATRDNPIAWTDVLYQTGTTLAAPAKGYAITGTTQFYGYTCYANPGNRFNVVEFIALNFGKVTKQDDNTALSANLFKGTSTTGLGILTQANIGVMPTAWQNAISETFLKKSTQTSNGTALSSLGNGGKGLYIASKYVLTAADVDTKPASTDVQPNPVCVSGQGA